MSIGTVCMPFANDIISSHTCVCIFMYLCACIHVQYACMCVYAVRMYVCVYFVCLLVDDRKVY